MGVRQLGRWQSGYFVCVGLEPIVTCSRPAAALDYARFGAGEAINQYTSDLLRYYYDGIPDKDSIACCYASLGRAVQLLVL